MKETIFLPPFFTKKMSVCTPSMISGLAILLVLINSTLLLLLLSSSSQSTYAQSFGNLTNLSNNTGFSSTPQITASGASVYVVWRDNSSGNDDIYFSASADNGTSFSSIENLSDNIGRSDEAQITAVGANVYVVWRDNSSGKDQIYFKRSSDNGNSFYPTEDLSNNNGSSTNPQITAIGNNVYTVWSDTTTGNGDIYFKSSIDNGTSFASSKNLSRNLNGTAHFPQLEATGNNVYVVWQDETPERGGIRYRASNDNGNNFSITRVLSQKNDVNANSPQIAVSENTVYIVWEDNSRSGNGNSSKNFDLLFRVSTNGGSNFTNTKVLTKNPGDSFDPQTAISGENMYAVWEDNTAGEGTSLNWEVRFRGIVYNGANTTDTKILSENIGELADDPQIAGSENKLYVVWSDLYQRTYPGMFDVFFTFSNDEGRNFSQAVNLSNNQGSSILSRIATSRDNSYIVWSDTTTGNGDIYFRSI
ncbi:MAG TPA: sialidase family protein, partial [Nitrososphaeraceae archaeon]|nr:sialidase family protein [Nitrososphaeraceae archaeon]